jgi:hypothetical protein
MMRLPTLALACALLFSIESQASTNSSITGLLARSGDRSVSLHWDRTTDSQEVGFNVYRGFAPNSINEKISPLPVESPSFADLRVTNGVHYFYSVRRVAAHGKEGAPSPAIEAAPHSFRDDREFLELLATTAFDYLWYEANPANGLIRDRNRPVSPCSIAAVGFGLTGIGIAINHGWITREAGSQRTLTTLRTLFAGRQGAAREGVMGYRGWFYHFLDANMGTRYRNCELSSIDTALLLAGILYAKEYFNGANAIEIEIRTLADSIYKRVDWRWMANEGSSFSMGWDPERGFLKARWIGYNEAMILLVLGLGAPGEVIDEKFWPEWTSGYKWGTRYGYSFLQFGPLFGHQYSHCWIAFKDIADPYMSAHKSNYFENSRRATLAQRNYAIENPKHRSGYSAATWGLTACDGPEYGSFPGYAARGLPPELDDGTLAPTAAGSSIVFTPVESIQALKAMYDNYRVSLWTGYGFRDAFNRDAAWWDPDVLGIDQGPMLLMIENYLTGSVWKTMQRNEIIKRGLKRAGFQARTLVK